MATLRNVVRAVFIRHSVKLRLNSDRLFMTLLIPHKPLFLVDTLGFVNGGEGSGSAVFKNTCTGNALLNQC